MVFKFPQVILICSYVENHCFKRSEGREFLLGDVTRKGCWAENLFRLGFVQQLERCARLSVNSRIFIYMLLVKEICFEYEDLFNIGTFLEPL